MKSVKYLFALLLLSLLSVYVMAQYDYPEEAAEENQKEQKRSRYQESKFFFGGNLGLSFGDYTYIEVAPLAGYKILPRLWVGLGPKYMYLKHRDFYETSIYGLKSFASFTIFQNMSEYIPINLGDLFAYAENESLNFDPYLNGERKWVNVMLVGGGLRFPIGRRSGLSILMLWDVTQNPEYNYANPELRMQFYF
jgi:hypothetical protein